MYEIEHNVPIPPAGQSRRHPQSYHPPDYQWERFAVGDSFLVPRCDAPARQALQNAAARYGKRRGWRFTTRSEGTGVRIWRVE